MQRGSDAVKGTMEILVSKERHLLERDPEQKPCECKILASMTAQRIAITIPDKNIVVEMRIRDILGAITAATDRYNQLRTQENFKNAMNQAKNGVRAEHHWQAKGDGGGKGKEGCGSWQSRRNGYSG